jgi:hypothetical protein
MYSITSLEYITKDFTLIMAGTSNVVLNSDRPSAPAIICCNSLKKGNKEEENKQIKSNQLIHSNIKLISRPIHLRMLFFFGVYFIIPFTVVLTMLFLFQFFSCHCYGHQPTPHQQVRSRRSAYAPADDGGDSGEGMCNN